MKRVLLTGATGFIGRHAIAPLIRLGYEVHAATHSIPPTRDDVCWHHVDLLDRAQIVELVSRSRPSHLLHFAWYTEHGRFWTASENLRWLAASVEMLRAFREAGGRRAMLAGTCAEYDWRHGYCVEHVTPCSPATLYGVSKNALQETLASYSAQSGLSSAWGRLFLLYGPGEHPARLVPSVALSLLSSKRARCSHGAQLRDFLHVADAAEAFCQLLDSAVTGPINVASGRPVAIRDVVARIADLISSENEIDFGALTVPPHDPPLLAADVTLLRKSIGWEGGRSLAAGLAETVESLRSAVPT